MVRMAKAKGGFLNTSQVRDHAKDFLTRIKIEFPELAPNDIPLLEVALEMEGRNWKDILTDKQWDVLYKYLAGGLTFSEIGRANGIDKDTARQCYQTAVGKIARKLREYALRDMSKTR